MLRHSVWCTIWPNRKGVYWGCIWAVYIIELADAKRLECLGNGKQPYDVSGRLSSSSGISSAGASSEGASSFSYCLRAAALFVFFAIIGLGRIPCILFGY